MTLDELIDLAKKNSNVPSDRILSAALGHSSPIVSQWRTGRSVPSDASIMALAKLAGIDTTIALVLSNIWRTQSDAAKAEYTKILSVLMSQNEAGTTPS